MTSTIRESRLSIVEQVSFLGSLFSDDSLSGGSAIYSEPDILESLDQLANKKSILSELKSVNWSFQDDNTTYLSHDIHP